MSTFLGSGLPIYSENNRFFDGFNFDSTGIRFGQYFWLIGGASSCIDKVGLAYGGNEFSYLWSIQKKRWFLGPKHPDSRLYFSYACPIVLNSTAILFIGLIKPQPGFPSSAFYPPNITIIFNFVTKS